MKEIKLFEYDLDRSMGVELDARKTNFRHDAPAIVCIAVEVDDSYRAAYLGIRDTKHLIRFLESCVRTYEPI